MPQTSEAQLVVSKPPMPETVDDLTVEWLQDKLSGQLNGAVIEGFEPTIIGVGEGFMGQLARVTLNYEGDPTDAPASLITKFAAARQDTRDMAADMNLYQREIGFYRDVGSDVGISIAECYYMEYHEDTNHFVLLLEDLAPGEPTDQVIGADRETSRAVIENIAKLHAKWWNSDRLLELDWAKWVVNEMSMEQALEMFNVSMKEVEETGKFDEYPEIKRLMPMLPPLLKFDPEPPLPFTLGHGDLRADNIIKPSANGGRFAVIDWQLCGIEDPVRDIVYWMVMSLSIEERRATEKELLKLYHDRLLEYGVKGFSFSKFMNAYRTNLVVVQLMFSMSMENVDKSSERAQALFHQFYSRLDAALIDWEVEKTLKVLPYLYPFIKATLIIRKFFQGRKRGK